MKKLILLSFIGIFFLQTGVKAERTEIITTETYIFKAKINKISIVEMELAIYVYNYNEFKKRKDGSIFIAGVDANWVVEMEIVSTEGADNILKKGEQITFIVHSPVRNIGYSKEEAAGKETNLELHVTHYEDGTISFALYPYLNKIKTSNEPLQRTQTLAGLRR